MTRRRSPPQQRKDNESVASATELIHMHVSQLSEMEFRATMVKMMSRLEKSINENVTENIESLRAEMRANLTEIKNSMSQMQSKLEALTARVTEAEERVSELEDGLVEEKTKIEAGLKKIHAHECRLREITDSMKRSNVRIIGIPEGVEKNRGLEEIFEQIVAENFPNLARETSIRVQEAERTPSKLNQDKPTPRHVIVQFANIRSKDTVLKAARAKKFLTYQGKGIRITSDLSTETWNERKAWGGIFKALSEKNMQPRILYPAKLSFRIDGEIKTFQNRQSLTNFVTTKPALQEILRGAL
uniref:L1 transposable element RRM domain-containing protein n=1 Tax=Ailuropoda melanoleuca TaxID=9646 RepID=A0A7N5P291_AILME